MQDLRERAAELPLSPGVYLYKDAYDTVIYVGKAKNLRNRLRSYVQDGPKRSAWTATWPKLAAIVIALGLWQVVVWSGWKPEYVLPAPLDVFGTLFDNLDTLTDAAGTTLFRAVEGFTLAVVIVIDRLSAFLRRMFLVPISSPAPAE